MPLRPLARAMIAGLTAAGGVAAGVGAAGCSTESTPLVVPTTAPVLTTLRVDLTTTTVAPIQQERVYVVQAGDTLGLIATRFGITVAELKEANGKTDDVILPGESLVIPPETVEPGGRAPEFYLVEAGDTLGQIAAEYGVTVDALMTANDKTSTVLSIGEQLIIPR